MNIKQGMTEHAQQLQQLMQHVEQSGLMLFNPGERRMTIEQCEQMIVHCAKPHNHLFVAQQQQRLEGYIMVLGETLSRTQHRASLVIGVHQDSRGKGVGTALFTEAIQWAQQQHIHRLELTVIAHNKQAIALYKKMGFVEEGCKRHSLMIDGKFVDEYYMSLLLDA